MSPIKTLRMKWKAAYSDDNENTSFFKSRLAHNIFLLSFVVFCGPCAIFYVLTKNPDTPMSYDDRLALKAITPPKPVKRQRALTLPSEDAFAQKLRGELRGERKKTQDQLESALFRLPAEVRIMVYEAYFGDEIILSLGNKRLKAYRAKYSVAGEDPIRFADVLPLLQSCRRIYSESIDLLYSTPTFYFFTIPSFLSFYASILPKRSNAITSIKFDFMQPQFYNSISPASGLKYQSIVSQCQTRVLLPQMSLKNSPSLWNTCCIVLWRMAGLKEVTVWADPEKFEPWHYGWDAYESLLCWLEYLKGRRVDMEVHVKGTLREVWGSTNVNRMWVWKHEGGEGKWLERI